MTWPKAQVGLCVSEAMQLTAADRQAVFRAIAATGATFVRVGLFWGLIEKSKHVYDFSVSDAVLNDAKAAGLKVLACIAHPPSYGWWTAAPSPADFGAFCQALAARSSARIVDAWEIDNEPNLAANAPGSSWKADPKAWTPYLIAGSAGIRRTLPSQPILLGGLAACATFTGITWTPWPRWFTNTDPVDFLKGVYAAGGKGSFDALSYHPYSIDRGFKNIAVAATDEYIADTRVLKQVMADHGDYGVIWATEFGWDTTTVSEADQAANLVSEMEVLNPLPLAVIFPYSWRDTGGQKFGLVRADNSPKPALAAFQNQLT